MTDSHLEAVTSATLSELMTLSIVLPSLYEELFIANARDRDLNLDEIMEMSERSAHEFAMADIKKITQATFENSAMLKNNLDQAKNAIKNQDLEALNHVEEEMALLEQEMAILKEELHTDQLTKTYNRKWLFEECLKYEKFRNDSVLTFITIEGFKELVDKFGFTVSDKILVYIAEVLKKIKSSSVVRFSEEKFLVISSKVTKEQTEKNLIQGQQFLDKRKARFKNESFKVNYSFATDSFGKDEDFSDAVNKLANKFQAV